MVIELHNRPGTGPDPWTDEVHHDGFAVEVNRVSRRVK